MSHAACHCSRCSPSQAEVQCSACGDEIRFGVREGVKAWHHREPVEHHPHLGHLMTAEYANGLAARGEGLDDDQKVVLEKIIEQRAQAVTLESLPPRSGLAQIANLVAGVTRVSPTTGKASKAKNAVPAAPGWELVNITHARGPYLGADGSVLSISDTHLLRARGPEVDGVRRFAVGSWRDLAFDHAYIGTITGARLRLAGLVSSDEMKDWIKT